ncbi:MAG: DUF4367 domain-containing protein [Clostridiaceae bacterium]|nr:DUF4367 domain-containing protein [Clostridiaceae bacterium]
MEVACDPVLLQKINEYMGSLLCELPSEQELADIQVLSFRFKRRMQRLVRKAQQRESELPQKKRFPLQRIPHPHASVRKRLVILVIIITILTTAFAVSASRDAIVGFVVQVFEKFSTIIFNSSPTESEPLSMPTDPRDITEHLPTAVPDGYSLSEQTGSEYFVRLIYTNTEGHYLLFVKEEKSSVRIDINTEGIQTESILIGEYRGIYYFNLGTGGLIWEDDWYAYSILGEITKDEMIHMAYSTK